MPSAFIVFTRHDTTDKEALAEYSALVGPSFAGRDVAFHGTYGKQRVLEGDAVDGVVVLEFPSWEAAEDWYFSDAYQEAIPHRLRGAGFRAVLVEGRPSN